MTHSKSFSDRALKLPIYYAIARLLDLEPSEDFDTDPELALILEELGVAGPEQKAEEIEALAAAAKERIALDPNMDISAKKYDRMRAEILAELGLKSVRGVRLWPPTYQTIMHRFGGSWANAQKECGLTPSSSGEVGRKNARFSETDRLRALCAYVTTCEETHPSFAGYTKWAKENDQPSGSNIRKVYGTWNNALKTVEELC
ncbi:MAG: hypothetical protein Q4E01_03545 [Actinomycetaceae bacterium]|nr:hypothetical protein [Actinomycetaceae bacterium]